MPAWSTEIANDFIRLAAVEGRACNLEAAPARQRVGVPELRLVIRPRRDALGVRRQGAHEGAPALARQSSGPPVHRTRLHTSRRRVGARR